VEGSRRRVMWKGHVEGSCGRVFWTGSGERVVEGRMEGLIDSSERIEGTNRRVWSAGALGWNCARAHAHTHTSTAVTRTSHAIGHAHTYTHPHPSARALTHVGRPDAHVLHGDSSLPLWPWAVVHRVLARLGRCVRKCAWARKYKAHQSVSLAYRTRIAQGVACMALSFWQWWSKQCASIRLELDFDLSRGILFICMALCRNRFPTRT
jgi:hypothetical protein